MSKNRVSFIAWIIFLVVAAVVGGYFYRVSKNPGVVAPATDQFSANHNQLPEGVEVVEEHGDTIIEDLFNNIEINLGDLRSEFRIDRGDYGLDGFGINIEGSGGVTLLIFEKNNDEDYFEYIDRLLDRGNEVSPTEERLIKKASETDYKYALTQLQDGPVPGQYSYYLLFNGDSRVFHLTSYSLELLERVKSGIRLK